MPSCLKLKVSHRLRCADKVTNSRIVISTSGLGQITWSFCFRLVIFASCSMVKLSANVSLLWRLSNRVNFGDTTHKTTCSELCSFLFRLTECPPKVLLEGALDDFQDGDNWARRLSTSSSTSRMNSVVATTACWGSFLRSNSEWIIRWDYWCFH